MSESSDSEALLRVKLEASEAKREVLELSRRVEELQCTLVEQTAIIKENTALLRKQRLPPRPYLNSTSKALIACKQGFNRRGVLRKIEEKRYHRKTLRNR